MYMGLFGKIVSDVRDGDLGGIREMHLSFFERRLP